MDSRLRFLEHQLNESPDDAAVGVRLLNEYRRSGMDEKYLDLRHKLGYVMETSKLPIPTREQTIAFLGYVTSAHSWYKHLSQSKPTRFFFFLDPHVMMCYKEKNGEKDVFTFRETTEEDRFHYNFRLTPDYRKTYGYWTYAEDKPAIYAENGRRIDVPEDLVNVGYADVTAAMYGFSEEDAQYAIDFSRRMHEVRPENFTDAENSLRERRLAEHGAMLKGMFDFLDALKEARKTFE